MAAGPARDRLGLAALILAFLVSVLPLAGTLVFEHPDEKHYTDGTIAMLQTGEWITPRWPDGALRLEKPILAFWPMAVSYRLLGVDVLSSRLPSLLASALVIALTYGVALTATGRRPVALLAALITASEPHVILGAAWATPDALLCLFMLISAWGALHLLGRAEPSGWAPWAMYGGAGLAIATKGLLGLVFVLFVWLFAWRSPGPAPPAARGAPAPAQHARRAGAGRVVVRRDRVDPRRRRARHLLQGPDGGRFRHALVAAARPRARSTPYSPGRACFPGARRSSVCTSLGAELPCHGRRKPASRASRCPGARCSC